MFVSHPLSVHLDAFFVGSDLFLVSNCCSFPIFSTISVFCTPDLQTYLYLSFWASGFASTHVCCTPACFVVSLCACVSVRPLGSGTLHVLLRSLSQRYGGRLAVKRLQGSINSSGWVIWFSVGRIGQCLCRIPGARSSQVKDAGQKKGETMPYGPLCQKPRRFVLKGLLSLQLGPCPSWESAFPTHLLWTLESSPQTAMQTRKRLALKKSPNLLMNLPDSTPLSENENLSFPTPQIALYLHDLARTLQKKKGPNRLPNPKVARKNLRFLAFSAQMHELSTNLRELFLASNVPMLGNASLDVSFLCLAKFEGKGPVL